MITTVLLTGDSKMATQLQQWLRQVSPDKTTSEVYPSLEAYKQMLEKAGEIPPGGAPPSEKDVKIIRLFVIDMDLVETKPAQWISELQKMTKEKAPKIVAPGAPRVLVMSFDGGPQKLDPLQNEAIDDLILKPVDKTLFQQKAEFLLGEDPKLQPTFLFRAKTAQSIEVGRDVSIDEISEFAVGIRSPGPLPEGTFASLHSESFGTKGGRRMVGRVYESLKHPVREGEYLVRFGFFGLTSDQLSTIRRYMKANTTPIRTKPVGPPGAGGAPPPVAGTTAKPGLSKELQEKMALLKMKKVAVIDMNPESLNEAKSIIESGFKGVVVRSIPSYARLLNDLRQLAPPVAAKPAAPAQQGQASGKPSGDVVAMDSALPGKRKLGFVMRGKSFELIRFEPALKRTEGVLSKAAGEFLEKPDTWLSMVEPSDREALMEFLGFVESGNPGKTYFRMNDATARPFHFEAFGQLEKSGAADGAVLLRMDLQEIDAATYAKNLTSAAPAGLGKDPGAFRFDTILIDSTLLKPDPVKWYEGFLELLTQTKVLGPEDQPPKIIVMSDPKTRARAEDFRLKSIVDFVQKPLDRRYLIQKMNALSPTLIQSRELESPPWVPCEIPAKLGKEVQMEEVSEYGLVIQHPSAFREKSYMKFFSRLFGEEGEWVSGKCSYCEKSGEGESFKCQFMFFGPGDELLQRIRRWIREDYVAKKDGKS